MDKKRILVPGGAGYIGAHTVAALAAAGVETVVVDNLSTGFLEALPPEARFYQGDIRDKDFLDSVFEKERIHGIIHFAAFSQVGSFVLSTLMNILPSWFMREESSTFRSFSFTFFICFAMARVGNALPSNI